MPFVCITVTCLIGTIAAIELILATLRRLRSFAENGVRLASQIHASRTGRRLKTAGASDSGADIWFECLSPAVLRALASR